MNKNTQRVVREIPALYDQNVGKANAKEVVCAYARVSTEFEEQEHSFELQCEHYTKQINARPEWEFGGIYADYGLTATKVDSRPEFKRMIEDCRQGKINKILVKSVSRFARNTVDALKYIRELKEQRISIHFENENVDTLTPGGELLITILAAIAEQESRNISTNIKWAYQKRFKDGRVLINCSHMLGYEKLEEGYGIVEEEAKTVRRVFEEYLLGASYQQIADKLMEEGIKTGAGKEKWAVSTVQGVLMNEKYTGNAILGKTFKADVLSKTRQKNRGQAPSYYVENSHPAIITQEMYDMVQEERKRRANITTTKKTGAGKYSSQYPLSGLLYCTCGSKFRRYGRKLRDGTPIATWVCITHQNNHAECNKLPLKENDIMDTYKRAVEQLMGDLREVKDSIGKVIGEVLKPRGCGDLEGVKEDLLVTQQRIMELFKMKQRGEIEISEYNKEYKNLSEKVIALRKEEESLKGVDIASEMERRKLEEVEKILGDKNINITEPRIMRGLVERIIVLSKKELEMHFTCGITRKITIE